MDFIREELISLVLKCEAFMEPLEVLRKVQKIVELESCNIILHKRFQEDVFDIFEKDENTNQLIDDGDRLCRMSKVLSHRAIKTCSQYSCDAVVELSECNKTIGTFASPLSLETSDCNPNQFTKKRKATSKPLSQDSVNLTYSFSEQSVSDHKRETAVSVVESPCRSINLTISMSRGKSGLDSCTLLDFQMLTASFSPSEVQHLIVNDEEEGEENNNDNGTESDSIQSDCEAENCGWSLRTKVKDAEANIDENGDKDSTPSEGDNADTSDYYHVMVDSQALNTLCDWLAFRVPSSLAKKSRCASTTRATDSLETNEETRRHLFYERHERCADMLMFLLSMPYVDDAWGIHTLILDHELGVQEGDEDDE